jgi:O-antigen/teichoic acid export membrane protein
VVITVTLWLLLATSKIRFSFKGFSWDITLAKEILGFAWPILPATILGYIVNWGNQVLIRHFFTTHDVGLYQSAFQVHSLIVSLAVPFTTIILPRLLDRHLEDPTVMKRYIDSIAPTLFCLWVLAMIPVISILPSVFRIVYGHQFLDSLPALTALLAGTLFCALGQIYTVLYTVQGKLGKLFWILAIMVTINMVFAWIIPSPQTISIRSIALAFSLAFVVSQFLTFYYQHRSLAGRGQKMMALLAACALFSLGESKIFNPLYRLGWGLFGLFMIMGTARLARAVEPSLLYRLFIGRLETAGKWLQVCLVPKEERAS